MSEFTTATTPFIKLPLPLAKYLQIETFSPTEINLVFYIIEQSLNFPKGEQLSRRWVPVFPSILNVHANQANRAIARLSSMSIFEVKTDTAKTLGGIQKVRFFRVATNAKINEACYELSISKNTIAKNIKVPTRAVPPEIEFFEEGTNESGGTETTNAVVPQQRVRCDHNNELGGTFYQFSLKYQKDRRLKEYIKNSYNNFINNISNYEFSFRELLGSLYATSRTIRSFELFLRDIVNQYGDFYAYSLVLAYLQDEVSNLGDFESLKRFYKKGFLEKYHEQVLKNHEDFLDQISRLYFELCEVREVSRNNNLDLKTQITIYFSQMALEKQSNSILIFETIEDSIQFEFMTTNSLDQFSKSVKGLIHRFFMSKIFSSRWQYAIAFKEGD